MCKFLLSNFVLLPALLFLHGKLFECTARVYIWKSGSHLPRNLPWWWWWWGGESLPSKEDFTDETNIYSTSDSFSSSKGVAKSMSSSNWKLKTFLGRSWVSGHFFNKVETPSLFFVIVTCESFPWEEAGSLGHGCGYKAFILVNSNTLSKNTFPKHCLWSVKLWLSSVRIRNCLGPGSVFVETVITSAHR